MLTDNMRLFDIATRQQIYIEGVKAQYAKEFNFVLGELRDEFTKLLGRVTYKTLDGLSKAELNKLVLSLRNSQSKIYSAYTVQLLQQLKDFMSADLQVSRVVLAEAFVELDNDKSDAIPLKDSNAMILMQETSKDNNAIYGIGAVTGNDDRLWSTIINTAMPANGLFLPAFLRGFSTSAQASIENLIRKAWANGWTVEETLAELSGEGNKQGTTSQLQRIGRQANAVISTAMQHTAQMVYAGVASAIFERYLWLSVMDSHTSEICIERNGNIYVFGRGPLPPGHILCRSHIAAIGSSVGNSDIPHESLYTWLRRQPRAIVADIMGELAAADFANAKTKPTGAINVVQPLTLKQFVGKIKAILTR